MEKYRHEWKHRLSPADVPALLQRLHAILTPDTHSENGVYMIRSLYFDDLYDTALREKIDGVSRREKFRIRYYDLDPNVIHLEKKSKVCGLGTKVSADLTAAQALSIISGDTQWMADDPHPLIRELYCKMKDHGLRPKTIVDYTRQAFVFPAGNVRVTLDYNIRTGLRCTDFLDPDCPTIPVPENPIILEVKWDEYLPIIIQNAVQINNRQAGAFSKYAVCRAYD